MPLVLLIVAAVILAGVVVVALGRGGELARFPADVRPFEAEIVTAADVVLLRPPSALFGYNRQVSDDVLSAIARTITERDVEIATLRRQLAELRASAGLGTAASARDAGGWPAPGSYPPAWDTPPPRASAESAWDPPETEPVIPPRASAESAWDPPAAGPAPPPRSAADEYAAAGSAPATAGDLRSPADSQASQDQDSQKDAR